MLQGKDAVDSRVYRFKCYRDGRGALSAAEFGIQIPFMPKRYFLVFDVGSEEMRGQHAHRICRQFLTCVSGQCSVTLDDGKLKNTFELLSPDQGLYIPPMTWVILNSFSLGAVLLAFASEHYEDNDYIRDYGQFLVEVAKL